MLNHTRSRMFVVFMIAILAMSVTAIYYTTTPIRKILNVTSIEMERIGLSASGEDSREERIPLQSEVEAVRPSRLSGSQSMLPDLAPTLVRSSTNAFLLPDLAPTLVKSSRDAFDLPDLAPTLTNPSLSPFQFSDLAPTLVQAEQASERLPDLAPTIVRSQGAIDPLPDLEPTLP